MMRNKIIVTLVTLLLCMTFLYTPALAVEDDEPDDLHEYINGDNGYTDEQIELAEPVPDPVTLQLMGSDLLELLELFTSDPDLTIAKAFCHSLHREQALSLITLRTLTEKSFLL